MRKMKLEPDALQVETFRTAAGEGAERGTVHGHFYSQVGTCDGRVGTCQLGGTCAYGCGSKGCTGSACV